MGFNHWRIVNAVANLPWECLAFLSVNTKSLHLGIEKVIKASMLYSLKLIKWDSFPSFFLNQQVSGSHFYNFFLWELPLWYKLFIFPFEKDFIGNDLIVLIVRYFKFSDKPEIGDGSETLWSVKSLQDEPFPIVWFFQVIYKTLQVILRYYISSVGHRHCTADWRNVWWHLLIEVFMVLVQGKANVVDFIFTWLLMERFDQLLTLILFLRHWFFRTDKLLIGDFFQL